MAKIDRRGKAAVLSASDKNKLRKAISHQPTRLCFEIGLYTLERWGAIVQLRVKDVFLEDMTLREEITFRAETRKRSKGGTASTRQVPIHPMLGTFLKSLEDVPTGFWLFPHPRDPLQHCSLALIDYHFRQAINLAGLAGKGISTHSTRRSGITEMANAGIGLDAIQAITGHSSVNVLRGYIDSNPYRIKAALAILS